MNDFQASPGGNGRRTEFRLEISRATGAATLWMAEESTPCGFKPILAWPSMEGVREFAHMLLDIDRRRDEDIRNAP